MTSEMTDKIRKMCQKVEARIHGERMQFDGFASEAILRALKADEDGDAWLYVELHRDRFCYDHAARTWYEWSGHYWQEDQVNQATKEIQALIEVYGEEAQRHAMARLQAEKVSKKEEAGQHKGLEDLLLKRISKLHSVSRKRDVLHLAAAGEGSLAIVGNEWDKTPSLLACKNGVVHLDTGEFEPGRQADFVKTACPTEWKGVDFPAPTWERFVSEIFDDCPSLSAYLQRVLGYAITGLTTDHVFNILWGSGRNGKGTLLETISYVLGPLAGPIQAEMLLEQWRVRSSAGPSPDIMALRGKRIVWASETDEGRKLNAGKVKWLVGGDTLVGRSPYGRRNVDFEPMHTVFLLTNHKPKADPTDLALWSRIHLIPFTLSFVDHPNGPHERKRDPNLRQKLKSEAPGVLAWLVRGCIEWQRLGLAPPAEVRDATSKYRLDEDILGQFLTERCVVRADASVQGGEFYRAYCDWANGNGFTPISNYKFSKRMTDTFDRDDSGRHREYIGVGLRADQGHEG